ncbi:MAG: hypothetical protein ACXAC8_03275 [Candidatus Hodarchaeales archaeon]
MHSRISSSSSALAFFWGFELSPFNSAIPLRVSSWFWIEPSECLSGVWRLGVFFRIFVFVLPLFVRESVLLVASAIGRKGASTYGILVCSITTNRPRIFFPYKPFRKTYIDGILVILPFLLYGGVGSLVVPFSPGGLFSVLCGLYFVFLFFFLLDGFFVVWGSVFVVRKS